jgi:hypothetical protein
MLLDFSRTSAPWSLNSEAEFNKMPENAHHTAFSKCSSRVSCDIPKEANFARKFVEGS